MNRFASGLLAAVLLLAWQQGARAEDPNALMRRMSSQPLRYGGALCCATDGRILLALDLPASDGSVRGEAMLLTMDRHLIATAQVSGTWRTGAVPGGQPCTLRVALPARRLVLDGLCTRGSLSGALSESGSQGATGEAWLTQDGFYQ